DFANGGAPQVLEPSTPYYSESPILVPGSVASFTRTVTSPVFLSDIALPVTAENGQSVNVQVPWELQGKGRAGLRADAGNSPFVQNELVALAPMFPRFEPLGAGETSVLGFKAVRGDFSGLLTSQPKPGDVFVAYMTGLGPV